MSVQFPSFVDWFTSVTKFIHDPSLITPEDSFTFVTGNESCDLDSFVSASLYAYLCELTKHDFNLLGDEFFTILPAYIKALYSPTEDWGRAVDFKHHHHFIPLITVPKDEFELRSLGVRVAKLLGIYTSLVTFQDLIDKKILDQLEFIEINDENRDWPSHGRGSRIPGNTRATFVLVDHNTPTKIHKELINKYKTPLQTIAIIDHHVDSGDNSHNVIHGCSVIQQSPRIIEICGSTTSLIINHFQQVIQVVNNKINNDDEKGENREYKMSQFLPTKLSPATFPYLIVSNNPKKFPSDVFTIADGAIAAIIVDTVGLDHNKEKRTLVDDTALFNLNCIDLLFTPDEEIIFSPTSPTYHNTSSNSVMDHILTPNLFTHDLFRHLKQLLEDITALSIEQLMFLDSKVVDTHINIKTNGNDGQSANTQVPLSILFAAVPTTMYSLLTNQRIASKCNHGDDDDHHRKHHHEELQIGENLINALDKQHNNYDLIFFCTYYITPNDNELQRELILSVKINTNKKNDNNNNNNNKDVTPKVTKKQDITTVPMDNSKLCRYLCHELLQDEGLYARLYPIPDLTGATTQFSYDLFKSHALNDNGIAIDVLKQSNSSLSRKYLLPFLSNVIKKFEMK